MSRSITSFKCVALAGAVFAGSGARADDQLPRPQTTLRATTVYRGLEEPGRGGFVELDQFFLGTTDGH